MCWTYTWSSTHTPIQSLWVCIHSTNACFPLLNIQIHIYWGNSHAGTLLIGGGLFCTSFQILRITSIRTLSTVWGFLPHIPLIRRFSKRAARPTPWRLQRHDGGGHGWPVGGKCSLELMFGRQNVFYGRTINQPCFQVSNGVHPVCRFTARRHIRDRQKEKQATLLRKTRQVMVLNQKPSQENTTTPMVLLGSRECGGRWVCIFFVYFQVWTHWQYETRNIKKTVGEMAPQLRQ